MFCTSIFIMSKIINKHHINTDRKNSCDLIRVFPNMNRSNFHQPPGASGKKKYYFPLWNLECYHSFGFAFKITSSVQIQASVSSWFVTHKTLSFYFSLSVWFAQRCKLFFVCWCFLTIFTVMKYIRNHNTKLFHL